MDPSPAGLHDVALDIPPSQEQSGGVIHARTPSPPRGEPSMSSKTPEGRLIDHIRAALRDQYPEAWVIKINGNPYQTAGVPDLLVCFRGRLVGLEVKCQRAGETREHARGRATPRQLAMIESIREAGGIAGVVLDVTDALEMVSLVEHEGDAR